MLFSYPIIYPPIEMPLMNPPPDQRLITHADFAPTPPLHNGAPTHVCMWRVVLKEISGHTLKIRECDIVKTWKRRRHEGEKEKWVFFFRQSMKGSLKNHFCFLKEPFM